MDFFFNYIFFYLYFSGSEFKRGLDYYFSRCEAKYKRIPVTFHFWLIKLR